jgi:hypothetical protein
MGLDKICRCCGEKIRLFSDANPNICLACAQLCADDSCPALRQEEYSFLLLLEPTEDGRKRQDWN